MGYIYAVRYLTFTQSFVSPTLPGNLGGWFGQSWSLAVEEWFYLLFSVSAFSLALIYKRRSLGIVCASFVIVPVALRYSAQTESLGWDAILSNIGQVTIYRFDAIAYGVVAALAVQKNLISKRSAVFLSVMAMALFVFNYYSVLGFHLGATLVFALPAAGFALAMPAANMWVTGPTAISAIVTWISTRSYALYIFHFSILEIALNLTKKAALNPWLGLAAAAAATLALADLSYRFLESPILRARPSQIRTGNTIISPVAI